MKSKCDSFYIRIGNELIQVLKMEWGVSMKTAYIWWHSLVLLYYFTFNDHLSKHTETIKLRQEEQLNSMLAKLADIKTFQIQIIKNYDFLLKMFNE